MVPVAVDEDTAAWRPDIVRRHPDPVGAVSHPEPGPPQITCVAPDPATGGVNVILIRGGGGWAGVNGRRRIGHIIDFLIVIGGPEAGRPLPAALDLLPVARHPVM